MQVMFFFCIVTNIVVSTQLILGGSAVITALTGMSVYAACMLIPLGITLYTATGQ
jgi:Na+/proline symporter